MKTIKALFGLFVVVAGFYVAFKVFPPYFNHYQLEDMIAQEARTASYSTKSEDEVREIVYAKARDLDIPITPQQVKVRRAGSMVQIDVQYSVHVDLPVKPLDLKFAASSKNKGL